MDKDQIDLLRQKWNEHSKGLNAGGVPIVAAGLKWQSMSVNATDAKLVETLKLTEQHIALAFRLPEQILGIGGTPFASTETLMQFWMASGLGFALNHIEEAFGQMFGLSGWPNEYCAFDTAALLRSNFKDRIEGLARAVQGGIFAPNEARDLEGYAAVDFGNEPRVQQQVVPLSFWGQKPPKPVVPAPQPKLPPAAAPPAAPDKAQGDQNAESAPGNVVGLRELVREKRRRDRIAA